MSMNSIAKSVKEFPIWTKKAKTSFWQTKRNWSGTEMWLYSVVLSATHIVLYRIDIYKFKWLDVMWGITFQQPSEYCNMYVFEIFWKIVCPVINVCSIENPSAFLRLINMIRESGLIPLELVWISTHHLHHSNGDEWIEHFH